MGLGQPLVAFPKPIRTTTGVGTITTTVTVTDCVLPSLPYLSLFSSASPQRRGGFRLFRTVFEQPIKSQLVGEINVDSVVQLSPSLSSFPFRPPPLSSRISIPILSRAFFVSFFRRVSTSNWTTRGALFSLPARSGFIKVRDNE